MVKHDLKSTYLILRDGLFIHFTQVSNKNFVFLELLRDSNQEGPPRKIKITPKKIEIVYFFFLKICFGNISIKMLYLCSGSLSQFQNNKLKNLRN